MKIADFVKDGISVINNMGEYRKTIDSSIVFRNGLVDGKSALYRPTA